MGNERAAIRPAVSDRDRGEAARRRRRGLRLGIFVGEPSVQFLLEMDDVAEEEPIAANDNPLRAPNGKD